MKKLYLCIVLALLVMNAPLLAQLKKLEAQGPAPDLADKLTLFGQFVGDWECDVVDILPDGSKQTSKCEWYWSWVLDGRAIQDVYIVHPDNAKPGTPPREHGTTLRFYDPKIDAWHCVWVGPVRDNLVTFTARKVGDEIILQTGNDNGRMAQWIFSQIKPDSFHWRSQVSNDSGKTWRVGQEMNVRRIRKD